MTPTVYEILNQIAQIEDDAQRAQALRQAMLKNNVIAIIVQRTYHPNYNFSLPKGPLPESIINLMRKAPHQEAGPLYTSIRKWDIFRIPEEVPNNANIKKHVIENHYISLYCSLSTGDALLLEGVKDKKLPWDSLNAEFIVDNFPELFPPSFRPGDTPVHHQEPVKENSTEQKTPQFDRPKTTKEQCLWIMQNNPGLTRKEYIELFQKVGATKATAGVYYQKFKDLV